MAELALAAGLGASAIGGVANYFAQKSANDTNVKLWREQAEWNKPQNQMKRLKEAGLNPYLYTTGVSGGEMSNAPTINANNGIGDAIGQASNMALNYASRKRELDIKQQAETRMQQQTDLNEEVIRKTTLDADLLDLEKQKKQWELNQLKASYNKTNHDMMMSELAHSLNTSRYQLEKWIAEHNASEEFTVLGVPIGKHKKSGNTDILYDNAEFEKWAKNLGY